MGIDTCIRNQSNGSDEDTLGTSSALVCCQCRGKNHLILAGRTRTYSNSISRIWRASFHSIDEHFGFLCRYADVRNNGKEMPHFFLCLLGST
jgi:hypothetical protein